MQRKIEELLLKEDFSNDLSGFYSNQTMLIFQIIEFYIIFGKPKNRTNINVKLFCPRKHSQM